MKTSESDNLSIITESYKENFQRVLNYISSYIPCREDAENLTQDVWMRLLTYDKNLCPETVMPLVFIIARNITYDYLRRLNNARCAAEDIKRDYAENTELAADEHLAAREIAAFETQRIERLPEQRRIIYIMSRFEEKSPDEIASSLALSKRTVENHLRLGRRDVRSYVAAIV